MAENEPDNHQNVNMDSKIGTICKFGCGNRIKFDKQKISKNGKFIPLNLDGSNHNCPSKIQRNWTSGQDLDPDSNEQKNDENTNRDTGSSPQQPSIYQTTEKKEYTNRQSEDILNRINSVHAKLSYIQSRLEVILQSFREFLEWEERKSKWK